MTRANNLSTLGRNIEGARDRFEAIAKSGLDWQAEKRQLAVQGKDGFYSVPAWGIFRRNGNGEKFLGAVGEQYEPIQNDEKFRIADEFIAANPQASYAYAGATGNGERVWVALNLGKFEVLPGDVHFACLLLSGSHDGSQAERGVIHILRQVCSNGMTVALANTTLFSIRHTRDAVRRLELARKSFEDVRSRVAYVEEILRGLAAHRLTSEQVNAILERIFPKTAKDDNERPVWSTRTENIVEDILKLYETSESIRGMKGAEGTAYGLLNAVTEWTNHLRGVRETEQRSGMTADQMRAENALFGAGGQLMREAMREIQGAVGVNGASVLQQMLA